MTTNGQISKSCEQLLNVIFKITIDADSCNEPCIGWLLHVLSIQQEKYYARL